MKAQLDAVEHLISNPFLRVIAVAQIIRAAANKQKAAQVDGHFTGLAGPEGKRDDQQSN